MSKSIQQTPRTFRLCVLIVFAIGVMIFALRTLNVGCSYGASVSMLSPNGKWVATQQEIGCWSEEQDEVSVKSADATFPILSSRVLFQDALGSYSGQPYVGWTGDSTLSISYSTGSKILVQRSKYRDVDVRYEAVPQIGHSNLGG
jgi:hypothetical protein